MSVHREKAIGGHSEKDTEGHCHLQAKESGLTRYQTCQHFDLRLLASRTVKNKFLLFGHAVWGTFLWQP